ncbi:Clp protease N-terminal domain-containing protein [Spongiactinospora rosea]|nr:Clp protease N-terminal domain-containing protein [Spongiactinospora rosea]
MRRTVLRRSLDRLLTDRAGKVLALAGRQAAAREQDVTPEDLLLAIAGLDQGVAVLSLERLGIRPRDIQRSFRSDDGPGGRTADVLRLARVSAFELGHRYIGTEHILLGIIREGRGAAARALAGLGAGLPAARDAVKATLLA